MNSEEIMLNKIKFVDENKEKIRENILVQIEYEDNKKTLVSILVKYLLDDTEYICKEYNSLKKFIDVTPSNDTPTELIDIMGIIKIFINKVCPGTTEEEMILNKLKKYDNIINFENKTLTKALA